MPSRSDALNLSSQSNATRPLAVVLTSLTAPGRELAALLSGLTTSTEPLWDVLALSPTLDPRSSRVRSFEAVICPDATSTFGSAWTLDEQTLAQEPCLRDERYLSSQAASASYARQCVQCRRKAGLTLASDSREVCLRPLGRPAPQLSASLARFARLVVERRCPCANLARALAGATARLVVIDGHVGELVALASALFKSGVGRPTALLHRDRRGPEVDKLHNFLRSHFMARTSAAATSVVRPPVRGWDEWHAEAAPGV